MGKIQTYAPKVKRGAPRFFDYFSPKKKHAVLRDLYARQKKKVNIRNLLPFKKRKIYNAFYRGCYFFAKGKENLIKEEYSYIQEFSVFIETIKNIKEDAKRVDVIKEYISNPLVNYYLRLCYDPHSMKIIFTFNKYFYDVNYKSCVSKFFIPSFTEIEKKFYDETIGKYEKKKYIMTYVVFYGKKHEMREILLKLTDNSGFCSIKKEKINEAIGSTIINEFKIRSGEKMLPREILRKLDTLENYFVVKRPLGVRAFVVIDGLGRLNVFAQSMRKGEFVRLKQKYIDAIYKQFFVFKNVVFECFVSTIDEENNITKNINAQYLSNQRRLKKYNLDNVHFFVYDVLTFNEYKQGYSELTYAERREKLESLFQDKELPNMHLCEGTQLKDKQHLISFASLAQEFDGKDYWDGLQFIPNGEYDIKDNVPEIFTRSYIEKTYDYNVQARENKEKRLNKIIEGYRKNRQSLACL